MIFLVLLFFYTISAQHQAPRVTSVHHLKQQLSDSGGEKAQTHVPDNPITVAYLDNKPTNGILVNNSKEEKVTDKPLNINDITPNTNDSSLSNKEENVPLPAEVAPHDVLRTTFEAAVTLPPESEDTPNSETCPSLQPNMDSLTQEQFINKLTDSCRYDRLIKPPTTQPLSVKMQVDLLHIESAEQLQFKAHMLVQYMYHDDRLRFEKISPNRGTILGEQLLRTKIWVPHLMIRNEKDSTIMGIDGKDVFVSINPIGDVVYSYRMTATFYCWMNLQKFPFDSQDCTIRWNSWTYNTSNLILDWDESPVRIASNLYLTEFSLTNPHSEKTTVPTSFTKGEFVGPFSELVFGFKLSREVGYYILDFFLPSILLVCTSWVTFWLQADAAPPRITLGTATMLSFITLNGGVTRNLPKVSYVKASDIWFLACTCFIFCSMAEFAFVNVIWRRRKKVELQKKSSKHILKGALTPSLARKQLRKAESTGSLYKPRSCTSLDSGSETENNRERNMQSNYLTVHSFPSIPTIKTQSADELIRNEDSVTSIPVPDGPKNGENPSQPQNTWQTMTPHEVATWIDKKSRIVFPLSFLIFNLFYWSFVYVL